MFYSGGARKKHALREILKFNPEKKEESEIDSSSEDHEPPRDDDDSESGNTDNSSDDSDTHAAENAEDTTDDDNDSSTYPADNNDYLVTLGSTNTTGKHYRYAFIDEELDYDLEEFADMHPDIKTYQFVIYKINTHSSSPFLEFLFYHEKDHDHDQDSCILPFYNHTLKRNIRKETDGIMRKLFTGKYRYKGFFHEISTDKCFIFYEKYYVHEVKHEKNAMVSLYSSSAAAHHWLWVCTNEILYQQRYMMIPIHDDAVNFFTNYPMVGILQATSISTSTSNIPQRRFHDINIEAPTVLYYGSDICYARNIAIYGAKREPIISRYGPFYYFTTLEHSFYWACYIKSDKKVKRRDTSNGGISRYAVFTKKMKTAFIDDDYDVDVVKKYIDRKNIFETKINQTRQTQEVYKANRLYDSIYAHGYDWTIDYDTMYNGYYDVDKKDVLRPVWCIHNHHNFQLLSYYEVNMDKTPEQYDPLFTDYAIM